MRYKKHFAFYANAPVDRANVDVAGKLLVLETALEGLSVYENGARAGVSASAQEWANFNFSPFQRTLYAPVPKWLNVNAINYLRVDFYDGEYTTDNDVAVHTYYYFVDDVKPDDQGEDNEDEALMHFSIALDPWATNVLEGGARFFGGEITSATDITPERFPHVGGDALRASSVVFPFNVEKWQTDGAEQIPINIIPTVNLYDPTGEPRYKILVSMTGKNLRRTVFATLTSALDTLLDAVNAAQYIATSSVVLITKALYPSNVLIGGGDTDVLETLEQGEWSIQALYILPEEFAPNPAATSRQYYGVNIYDYNDNGDVVFVRNYMLRDISAPDNPAPLNKRVNINFRALYARYVGGATTPEEVADFLEGEFGGLRPCMRIDVGTLTNRVDITENVFKNGTTQVPDAFVNVVYGYQTFNIFLHVGARKIDITNDFQTYTLLDPENEFIKNNKTNSILSGLGSVGTIAGGIVSLASGAGAGIGLAAIASGATSLVSTISRWQEGTSVPDAIKGVGYADTTNLYGGVFITATRRVNAWERAVVLNGFKTQIPTGGEWFLDPYGETRQGGCFALSVDGARVVGMPAGDAEEVATLLRRGVRLWYTPYTWAERAP